MHISCGISSSFESTHWKIVHTHISIRNRSFFVQCIRSYLARPRFHCKTKTNCMRIEIYGIGTSAEADVFATSQIIKRPTNAVLAINVDMQVRSMDERWKKWQIKSMAIKIQCLMVFIWISLEQWVTVLFASLYHLEFDGAILFHSYNFKCVLHWYINDEFFPSLFPNDEHSRWKDTHRISEFASHCTHCLCMCACVSLWLPRNKNTHT